MKVFFKRSFIRDFNKLPKGVKPRVKELCFDVLPKTKNLSEISHYVPQKISGFPYYYRIRIGSFRLGFKKEKDVIILMRVLDRKDIYKYFP